MIIKWLLMMSLAVVLQVQHCASVPLDQPTPMTLKSAVITANITVADKTASSNDTSASQRSSDTALNPTEKVTINGTSEASVGTSDDSNSNSTIPKRQSPRRGRIMDISKLLNLFKPTEADWKEMTSPDDNNDDKDDYKPIQSRILTGGSGILASLEELADNTFSANERRIAYSSPTKQMTLDGVVNDKYDSALINAAPAPAALSSSLVKTYQPKDRYESLSYSNPAVKSDAMSGYESSDLANFYHDQSGAGNIRGRPMLYKLVPVGNNDDHHMSYTHFTDAVKETLLSVGDKVKDHVSGTVQKVKNALGFNGFSEKVASPDALIAVAPVAAGLLAGGLAVAYLASKAGQKNNASMPFNFLGKRSVRNAMTEDDLQHIVARLDPVQREYLEKLQMYGPQRWKDVTCAKYIFCDVMSRATPLHVRDMQRKIGVFLSRMEETTARYVEVILKDVMLAIQARDCSRFSCSQTSWGLPHGPPPPQQPQLPPGGGGGLGGVGIPTQGVIGHPFQFMPGNNFLRRQRAKN